LVALAQDYQLIDSTEKSAKKWDQAMALDKTKIKERIEYIKFCIQTKKTRKALETISEILKIEPKREENLILASCLLMSEGRGEEASVYIKTLLDKKPTDLTMNTLLSFLYFEIFEECELLGNKYFERSKRIKLRELGKVQSVDEVRQRPAWKFYQFVEEI